MCAAQWPCRRTPQRDARRVIVGFGTETDNVVPGMVACIEEAAIPVTMLSLLYALPIRN